MNTGNIPRNMWPAGTKLRQKSPQGNEFEDADAIIQNNDRSDFAHFIQCIIEFPIVNMLANASIGTVLAFGSQNMKIMSCFLS